MIPQLPLYPPRFRNEEDGRLYMECLQMQKQFPMEKWIWPFIVVDGKSVENPEYTHAVIEVGFMYTKELAP